MPEEAQPAPTVQEPAQTTGMTPPKKSHTLAIILSCVGGLLFIALIITAILLIMRYSQPKTVGFDACGTITREDASKAWGGKVSFVPKASNGWIDPSDSAVVSKGTYSNCTYSGDKNNPKLTTFIDIYYSSDKNLALSTFNQWKSSYGSERDSKSIPNMGEEAFYSGEERGMTVVLSGNYALIIQALDDKKPNQQAIDTITKQLMKNLKLPASSPRSAESVQAEKDTIDACKLVGPDIINKAWGGGYTFEVNTSEGTIYPSTDSKQTSSCTYGDAAKAKYMTLEVSFNPDESKVKEDFMSDKTSAQKSNEADSVSGIGESAYFDTFLRELHILKGRYVISVNADDGREPNRFVSKTVALQALQAIKG